MPHVLENWILKSELATKHYLCPSCLLWIGEYPTFIVFCLNDENAKFGDKNVIDLGSPIFELKCDVIEKMKIGRGKVGLDCFGNQGFPSILE